MIIEWIQALFTENNLNLNELREKLIINEFLIIICKVCVA